MKKLGVIVPYRNRWEHYYIFIYCIKKYLEAQNIEHDIILVEQDNSGAFNRGMLCNIGFKKAEELNCDYVVFHDVDMIPQDIDYSYSDYPVHLASSDLPFESYFGGITLFPMGIFKKINGFSNRYWGWGFEDDDLRYRCVKNNVKFYKNYNLITPSKVKNMIFNGVDAYAVVQNHLHSARSFEIEINCRLDNNPYDFEKPFDKFTLLEIEARNNFSLFYSSFRRFTLEFADSRGKVYSVTSNQIYKNANKLHIKYNADKRQIVFTCNEEVVEEINLKFKLANYRSSENITIGASSKKNNFFKGSIDTLIIYDSTHQCEYFFKDVKTADYKWKDFSGKSRNAKLVSVYHNFFEEPTNYDGYIPFRREGTIERLPHTGNGYINGAWKDNLTRWNQLRYNNEVLLNNLDTSDEGLSSCEFALHDTKINNNVYHLIVGIS